MEPRTSRIAIRSANRLTAKLGFLLHPMVYYLYQKSVMRPKPLSSGVSET